MTPLAAQQTRRAAETILDAVRQRPGITVPELAAEVKRLDRETLERVRDAFDIAIADKRPRTNPTLEAWGDAPAARELAAARAVGDHARQAALADALEGALTREQASARLGITAQAVSERMKAGKLTAIRRGREWRFPAWQFGDDDALPGLPELTAAWPGTPLALSTWAVKPSPDLGGRTPAQEMRRRDGVERVLDIVQSISEAAW